jgi:hypothetical protein
MPTYRSARGRSTFFSCAATLRSFFFGDLSANCVTGRQGDELFSLI